MCGSGQKSWANEEIIKFWLKKLWGVNNMNRHILVWDSFRAQLLDLVKKMVPTTNSTDMCVSYLVDVHIGYNQQMCLGTGLSKLSLLSCMMNGCLTSLLTTRKMETERPQANPCLK